MKKLLALVVVAAFLVPFVAGRQPTAGISANKQEGFPLLKTVGPGTKSVSYDITIENTGSFKAILWDQYEVCLEGGTSTDQWIVLAAGSEKTLYPGDCVTISGKSSTVSPGSEVSRVLTIDLRNNGDATTGQTGDLTFKVKDTNGNTLDSTTKTLKVQSPSATISVSVAGVTLAIGGFSLAGLGAFKVI